MQISDIHVGPVDRDYLTACLRTVADLRPDVLVVTGDFVDRGSDAQLDDLARVLEHLPSAPLGTFGVLGNHDYGHGWQTAEIGDRVARRAADRGVRVLRNEITDLAGLQLFGLDDLWAQRCNVVMVVGKLDTNRSALGLCHNPDALDRPGWDGFRGWVLAGHTHGGQCKPPFLPPPILPVANRRYTAGHIDVGDGRHLYINRGLGYIHRVRFNARPEITHFTLQPA